MKKKNDYISIIVKPTNACNLRCKHCYHAEMGYDADKMSDEVLERLMSSTLPYFTGTSYIWHGGEPLTMPLSFYERAFELEEKYRARDKQPIKNSMQSNGTYITDEVAKFIADNRILIGLSFEGPYNDILRSHTVETERGYANLKKHNIVPGTISVVGNHNVNDLVKIYEYFRSESRPLKLNPIFAAGAAKENDEILLKDPEHYAQRMCELFDIWMFDTTTGITINPFLGYVQSVLAGLPRCCTNRGCLKHWLCVHPNGDIYPCGRAYPEEYCLGNIMDVTDLHEVFETDIYKDILKKSIIRREKCRKQCEVYRHCNGGCLNEAILEGGIENIPEFSCTSFRIIIKHVEEQVKKAVERGKDYLNCYNIYIRNILKSRMEMNENGK